MQDGELELQTQQELLTGHHGRHGYKMISIDEKKEILNGKIEILSDLISRLDPFKDEVSDNKISNITILENAISEKNTYTQLLAEL
jgi:hypothetical protein